MAMPQKNYQRINVTTADPLHLVVLLYEGAIRNLNQSIHLWEKDAMTASEKISRALDIINYLRNTLDMSQGGDIARNLERLYEYMRDCLAKANIERDVDKTREVIKLLHTLLEGWRGIAENQEDASGAAGVQSAPAPRESGSLSMFVG